MAAYELRTIYNTTRYPRLYDEDFIPGALYVTISIPGRTFLNRSGHIYPDSLPANAMFKTYEQGAANGSYEEEFHWDLYYHQSPGVGKIYRLRRNVFDQGPDTFHLDVLDHVHDARRMSQVVGFVRVLSVPPEHMGAYLERYLDWLALTTAPEAERTFV